MVKFNLEQSTSVGRMGCLKYWGDITVDHATPSYMIYTRAGHIPHLTWDAVNRFLHFNQKQIFQLTLPTLIESSESLRCFGEGISAYCSMPKGAPTHMSVLDPLGFMQHGFNDSKSISIWTKSGRKRIDVRTYMDVIKCCKSTTFETLLDFDTPRECSEKRLGKSISRTKDFCEAILNDSSTFKAHPIVTVGGGHSLKHREEFVQKLGSLSLILPQRFFELLLALFLHRKLLNLLAVELTYSIHRMPYCLLNLASRFN